MSELTYASRRPRATRRRGGGGGADLGGKGQEDEDTLWGNSALLDDLGCGGGEITVEDRESADTGGSMDAAVDGGQPTVGQTFYSMLATSTLFREEGAGLAPTGAAIQAGEVVRSATPATGRPEKTVEGADYDYITRGGELFGWVNDDALSVIDPSLVGESEEQEAPDNSELPELGAGAVRRQSYVDTLSADVLSEASAGSSVLATCTRMEMVTRLTDASVGDGGFVKVRTLSGVTGWMSGDNLADVPDVAVTADGTWVGGYTLTSGSDCNQLTGTGGDEGQGSSEAVWNYFDGLRAGAPVEVMYSGGGPAISKQGGRDMVYVREAAGQVGANTEGREDQENGGDNCGWVPARLLDPALGEGDDPAQGSSVLEELQQTCPNGITVAFAPQYDAASGEPGTDQGGTFLYEAVGFAQANQAVAIQGGQLVVGGVNLIQGKEDMLGAIAGIQAALRGKDGAVPPWARVRHLAIFAHGEVCKEGEYGGIDTASDGWYGGGTLRQEDLLGFAKSLSAFGTQDLEVSLFSCHAGRASDETKDWREPDEQDPTGGDGAFADQLQDALSAAGMEDSRVLAHTTEGPTVNNPFARIFAGDPAGGVTLFNYVFDPVSSWAGDQIKAIEQSLYVEGGLSGSDFVRTRLFEWFIPFIRDGQDSQLSASMSTDPESFRVNMRNKAFNWLNAQLPVWGVFPEGMSVSVGQAVNSRVRASNGFSAGGPQVLPTMSLTTANDGTAVSYPDGNGYTVCVYAADLGKNVYLRASWLDMGASS